MKLRFSFATVRPVGHYAKLCNQFLQHPHVKAIYADDKGYFIEAEGEVAELEPLADLLASTFPLSCWVTATNTVVIEEFTGEARPLPVALTPVAYCRHCQDKQADDCSHCGTKADGFVDVHGLLETLLEFGQVSYDNRNGRRSLTLLNNLDKHTSSLMFCDPQALNSALYIDNSGVLMLSSQEKPQLRLQPRPEFTEQHQLARPLYNCHLADDRISLALAAMLAQQGIVAVGSDSDYRPLLISQWIDGPAAMQGDQELKPLPVREPVQHRAIVGEFEARYDDGHAYLSRTALSQAVDPQLAAHYALEGLQQQQRFSDSTAVLYLSRHHQSGLIYKNANGEREWLMRLPYADNNPADLLTKLVETSDTAERLLTRYQHQHGDWLAQLTGTNHRRVRGNLSGIMAMVAWLLELDCSNDAELAAEQLLATALGHEQLVSPRLDYKLEIDEEGIVVNWLPVLQACMSYRLASPDTPQGIAFGVIDSFADFVGNWIEQFDKDIGLNTIVLAGDEFDNPILLQQIRLRLGRNVTLKLPQPLDLAGNNLALGALFVSANKIGTAPSSARIAEEA
ncbi:hypothetical protein [Ferrimonas lipolytica]|uniref:Carbamoyltransferase Kae1-like domain-containing protein n=1 Tax=Ferrimonas lipolytica TaxID=2724191 RepID=A0A6H1UDX7_9GAMM|nr:hypothetical protein [Ferrimonas lipolytica]QIZ76426.1 hypothetical protein HER31_05860 [Ferrimonas lipolytica]